MRAQRSRGPARGPGGSEGPEPALLRVPRRYSTPRAAAIWLRDLHMIRVWELGPCGAGWRGGRARGEQLRRGAGVPERDSGRGASL